jgi:hypothetical protein
MVCFRYMIVSTVHKGGNKDDNNSNNNNNNNMFVMCVLTCWLSSTSANCQASTKKNTTQVHESDTKFGKKNQKR